MAGDPVNGETLERRLAEEQRILTPMRNYGEAFRSPTVMALSAQYFLWSIGVYGFVIWLPSMLKAGSSLGIVQVGWLSAAPYLVATILMVVVSYLSGPVRPPQGIRLAVPDCRCHRIRRVLRAG